MALLEESHRSVIFPFLRVRHYRDLMEFLQRYIIQKFERKEKIYQVTLSLISCKFSRLRVLTVTKILRVKF